MKRATLILSLVLAVLLTACSAPSAAREANKPSAATGGVAPQPGNFGAPEIAQDALPAQQPKAAPAIQATGAPAAPSSNNAQTVERLVIKNAVMAIVVDDTTNTVNSLTRMSEEMGGFVVSLNTTQLTTSAGKKVQRAKMVLRVPSEKLNEAMLKIKSLSVEVSSETVSGQDVTAEYTDLKSQLTNLERAEKQLQTFLDQSKNTDETLRVYNQLVSIRQQIETIKGRMKYYEQSAALSMITLDITPNALNAPIQVAGWRPEGTVKESIETLINILQDLVDFIIRFGIVCMPFIIVLGVPLFFFGRWAVKKWIIKK